MRFATRAATVVAATMLAVSSLGAQMKFSIAAGATAPIGDAGDAFALGYNATAGLSFKPAVAPIGLRAEAMYNQLGGKDPSPVGARIMALTANGTYSVVPNLYVIGGVGMYNSKATDLPAGFTAESTNDFGINVGAGFNFPLPSLQPFAEVRFHHVLTEGTATQLIPITFGIRF